MTRTASAGEITGWSWKAENNFYDHSTGSDVLTNEVTGNVDVDPLGANLSQ